MYHMGAPRGQPLEPCPLGAPVESLWGCYPSDPTLWELLPLGVLPLRPHPLGAPAEGLWGHYSSSPTL